MTYKKLKTLVKGLLIGDTAMPIDNDTTLALMDYSLNMISEKAESMHLLTLNKSEIIQRMATGSYMIRKPVLPEKDEDEIDIDEDLCFALARYMASLLSREKGEVHRNYGDDVIMKYNHKVYQILEDIKLKTENAEYYGCLEKCIDDNPEAYNG